MVSRPVLYSATESPERCRKFYETSLGFRLIEDTPHEVVMDAVGTTLRIQKVKRVSAAQYVVLGWEVDDIVHVVHALGEKGVRCLRSKVLAQDDDGIWLAPDGAMVAWLQDPDGHTIALTQLPKPQSGRHGDVVPTLSKSVIVGAISRLPDDATLEDAFETLFFLQKIERGLDDSRQGKVMTHDEAVAHFRTVIARKKSEKQ